ncbi:MAG: ATP-dependent helicase, partial [Bacteroidia bacterium]
IDKQNRLHPYYIVYLKDNGELVYNHVDAKKSLDIFRLVCKGKQMPLEALAKQFCDETNDYRKMDAYSNLLQKSISTILKTEEEKDVMSLFKSGGTSALRSQIKGIEDFKLISFLVIK